MPAGLLIVAGAAERFGGGGKALAVVLRHPAHEAELAPVRAGVGAQGAHLAVIFEEAVAPQQLLPFALAQPVRGRGELLRLLARRLRVLRQLRYALGGHAREPRALGRLLALEAVLAHQLRRAQLVVRQRHIDAAHLALFRAHAEEVDEVLALGLRGQVRPVLLRRGAEGHRHVRGAQQLADVHRQLFIGLQRRAQRLVVRRQAQLGVLLREHARRLGGDARDIAGAVLRRIAPVPELGKGGLHPQFRHQGDGGVQRQAAVVRRVRRLRAPPEEARRLKRVELPVEHKVTDSGIQLIQRARYRGPQQPVRSQIPTSSL